MYNSGHSHGLPGVNNTVSKVWTQIIMGGWGGGGGVGEGISNNNNNR